MSRLTPEQKKRYDRIMRWAGLKDLLSIAGCLFGLVAGIALALGLLLAVVLGVLDIFGVI